MRPLILVLLLCAPLPVIFVFHGHGGNMNNAYRLGIQRHWPEAWVVCPQGLPASTARDPEDKRSGW